MLDGEVIVGLLMAAIEIMKRRWQLDSSMIPFIAIVLGAVLNGLNALAFGDGASIADAVRDGIVLAGLAMGIWSGAKAATSKRPTETDFGADA